MAEIAELNDQNYQKAIDCYSKYLEKNQNDTKIILKSFILYFFFSKVLNFCLILYDLVCSCFLKLDKFDSNQASRWLNKADQYFPYESQVIEFKERLFANLEFQTVNSDDPSTNEWEMFLLKGLEQNYYNEELHFKLVKMYLKKDDNNKCVYKAVRHLLAVEQKSLFDSSSTWHKSIIDLIEKFSHFVLNDPSYSDKYELINFVYLILNYHYILISLQHENTIEHIMSLFIK